MRIQIRNVMTQNDRYVPGLEFPREDCKGKKTTKHQEKLHQHFKNNEYAVFSQTKEH